MKLLSLIVIMVAVLGLMAFKNPSPDDYNNYVRQVVVKEMQKKAEQEGGGPFGQMLAPLLGNLAGGLMASQTVRSDYIFFSLYEARLGTERLKLLGILAHFFVLEKPDIKNLTSPRTNSDSKKPIFFNR